MTIRNAPRSATRACLLAVPLLLIACAAPSDDGPRPNGALGQRDFRYACVTASDAFCTDPSHGLLPNGIAAGAEFRLEVLDPSAASITLEPASMEALEHMPDGHFSAKRAGYASVLARTAPGDVIDFLTLPIRFVARIDIAGAEAVGTFGVGDEREVRAEPRDQSSNALAGALRYAWETSNPTVLQIIVTDEDLARGGATLRAVAPGVARVRVLSGSSTSSVDIVVGG